MAVRLEREPRVKAKIKVVAAAAKLAAEKVEEEDSTPPVSGDRLEKDA